MNDKDGEINHDPTHIVIYNDFYTITVKDGLIKEDSKTAHWIKQRLTESFAAQLCQRNPAAFELIKQTDPNFNVYLNIVESLPNMEFRFDYKVYDLPEGGHRTQFRCVLRPNSEIRTFTIQKIIEKEEPKA